MPGAGRTQSRPGGLVAGSLFAFVVLGLPGGMLGVAWPALRHDFGQPLASLGELLLASVAGYLAVTSASGWALRRSGTAAVLTASAGLGVAGTAVFAVTRSWTLLVCASVVTGAAGGGLDAALNTAVALAGRTRLMNMIHAAFGVGAALGPLLVTGALVAASSWRYAYLLLAVLEICLTAVWVALRNSFSPLPGRGSGDGGSGRPSAGRTSVGRTSAGRTSAGRGPGRLLGISLVVFFCYAGLEIAVASWSASFLRGPGRLSVTSAGVAVFGYWAGLTAARAGVAALGSRISPHNAVRAGTVGAALGAAAIWANVTPVMTVTAFVVIGMSLGPIFPALMNLTPARVGSVAAVSAVGWELAASGLGGAALPALAGVVLQVAGLAAFGPVLVLLALVLCGLNLMLERRSVAARKDQVLA